MISLYIRITVLLGLLFFFLNCKGDNYPTSPYTPDTEDTPTSDSEDTSDMTWQVLLASDSNYPENVYLTEFVEWEPGLVGSARMGTEYTDDSGYPLVSLTENAFGPPEGGGPHTGGEGLTCPVGINGSATWKFNPDYVIINGEGDDFMTFTKTWAWAGAIDGLCCELAFVQVSADGVTWYEVDPSLVTYDPGSTEDNTNYIYANVANLHGNAPTTANFRTDMPAETIQTINSEEVWAENGETVSKYFTPEDPYLGGVYFDLSNFVKVGDSSQSWPSDGKMRYLKIIDSDTILDGQDYSKDWCLGANLMAAMGINTEPAP